VSAKYLIYFSAYIHGRSAATWGYLAANFKWAGGMEGFLLLAIVFSISPMQSILPPPPFATEKPPSKTATPEGLH